MRVDTSMAQNYDKFLYRNSSVVLVIDIYLLFMWFKTEMCYCVPYTKVLLMSYPLE